MPLERVNLARGKVGTSADGGSAAEKFQATPEELHVIQEKMKDPVFLELMHDYIKSLEDPETRREEEAYLEQAEREARESGDFSFEFVFPRPAYVVELLEPSNTRLTAAEAKQVGVSDASKIPPVRSYLNMCQSEKVKTFTEHTTGDRSSSNWEVPVSVSRRRVEAYNPVPSSPDAHIPAEYAATVPSTSATTTSGQLPCIVHDVVFHPSTLALAERSNKFMCFLTEIAVEHVNSGYGESNGFKFRRLPSSIKSIGTPQNQTLRSKEGVNPFAVDPKAPVLQRPTRHIPDSEKPLKNAEATTKAAQNSSSASVEKKADSLDESASVLTTKPVASPDVASVTTTESPQLPPHTISHRGSIDLTDAWRWSVSDKRIGVPEELIVKLTFAGVRRAAALDIAITEEGRTVRIDRTEDQPVYAGELTLPFRVEDVPKQAQFDRSRGVLTLTLKVVPPPLPQGVPTAEELRRTLPGAVSGTTEENESKSMDTDGQLMETTNASEAPPVAVALVMHDSDRGGKCTKSQSVQNVSSFAPDAPTSSSPGQYSSKRLGDLSADTVSPAATAATSFTTATAPPPSSKPEVSHIGNQDRVAAMMAEVGAARAARIAAAAAASAPAKNSQSTTEQANAEADESATQVTSATQHTDPTVTETKGEKGEEIPFVCKGGGPSAALNALKDARVVKDDVEAVRARQQAWAAMMEAEMQVAKAREEAEAAEAARAMEVQAAKARRKLAAEKEQERMEQIAQAKRDTLPLSNKYIFAID